MGAILRAIVLAIVAAMTLGTGWAWAIGGYAAAKIFGGGGGTVIPPKTLDLPDADYAAEAIDRSRSQQEAVDAIIATPARQVMAWATATPAGRDTIPLTLLSTDQVDWLETRSRAEIAELAKASEYKIDEALQGREDAISEVMSVGQKTKKSGPLEDRILAFRSGDLAPPPQYPH